jgi:hypothetical protein
MVRSSRSYASSNHESFMETVTVTVVKEDPGPQPATHEGRVDEELTDQHIGPDRTFETQVIGDPVVPHLLRPADPQDDAVALAFQANQVDRFPSHGARLAGLAACVVDEVRRPAWADGPASR